MNHAPNSNDSLRVRINQKTRSKSMRITKEKIHTIAGPEFGEFKGRVMIIQKLLCGSCESGARWHEALSAKLRSMGFTPSKADSDLWIRKLEDHCECIATHVDDLLIWSRKPEELINIIKKDFKLKGVGIPEFYLGGDVEFLNEHWTKDKHQCRLLQQNMHQIAKDC